ncbi:MAG TPA: hypothetical protein VK566_10675 [Nitrososphaeraceae archaeon]|nr:hypothetical protein [Nitrososphaeraceae archaeon]
MSVMIKTVVERELKFKLAASERQFREMKYYLSLLHPESIVSGLKFAYNRQKAQDGGYLILGRKSFVKKETSMLTKEQARWRLANWKSMIRTYRNKGYSYPTISRIKKDIRLIAKSGNKK